MGFTTQALRISLNQITAKERMELSPMRSHLITSQLYRSFSLLAPLHPMHQQAHSNREQYRKCRFY